MTKVFEVFGCPSAVAANLHLHEEFVAGVECEIEEISRWPEPLDELGFTKTTDGSLRNNGAEFVSAPMKKNDLITQFTLLHKGLKLGKEPFSERTSTHIHVNVSNLDVVAARNLVLLYALFEEVFFAMVKPIRRDNIHCVPLTETHLPSIYKRPVTDYVKQWSKYTALNLKRMVDLGTMEFRHLHGTGDPEEFKMWVNTLHNLWTLSQQVQLCEDTLNEKNILIWFEAVFKDAPEKIRQLRTSLFEVIRNNLIDVKFSI